MLGGLVDDPEAPFVEHGIVEHRFARAASQLYRELVIRYGHTSIKPQRHTASSMIGMALGILQREGQLASLRRRGTGYWSFNSEVGYWALTPGPASQALLTWAQLAEDLGIDPLTWHATAQASVEAQGA